MGRHGVMRDRGLACQFTRRDAVFSCPHQQAKCRQPVFLCQCAQRTNCVTCFHMSRNIDILAFGQVTFLFRIHRCLRQARVHTLPDVVFPLRRHAIMPTIPLFVAVVKCVVCDVLKGAFVGRIVRNGGGLAILVGVTDLQSGRYMSDMLISRWQWPQKSLHCAPRNSHRIKVDKHVDD